MKRTVVLSIQGKQRYEDQEPEVIELVTEGTMEFRAGGWDISYEESALTGLEGVTTIHARAEEPPAEYREAFDIATARAVTRLDALCELCLPMVKKGGAFVAMKGPAAAEELKEAEKAIKVLGGKLEKIHEYTIPDTDVTHTVVVIRKVGTTPKQYPRAWGKIKKAPIR